MKTSRQNTTYSAGDSFLLILKYNEYNAHFNDQILTSNLYFLNFNPLIPNF